MTTHLKAGDPAPDFAAPATDGSILRLEDFRGRKLVMYFYPMDSTPGCTKQACSLRDANAEIAARGAAILGVSAQGTESHQRFTEKFNHQGWVVCCAAWRGSASGSPSSSTRKVASIT